MSTASACEPCDLSAVEARRLIGQKKLSPVELFDSCIARVESTNASVNAFVTLDIERGREAALRAEAEVARGEVLPLLHGLPIGVKDLDATAGLRTTKGSLLHKDDIPTDDDSQIADIRAAGGIILGKTNTPEFGLGANTTNKLFGATGNPFDPAKTCGGSSGGSAVVLACGMVPLATGSDFGGSLRTPASFCGVVGFRPSPGLVPTTSNAVSLWPFSVKGPMGRSVEDAHLLLKAQLGRDKRDPFSGDDERRIPDKLSGVDLSTLRVAFSQDLGCAPIDTSIAAGFETKARTFRHIFKEAQDRDPDLGRVSDCFEILRGVAVVAEHKQRVAKHRELLGPNAVDNVERGLAYSLADVAWAQVEQTRIYRRFLRLFDDIDVLICPATSVSPFPHAQLSVDAINGTPMPTYMSWLAITYALSTTLSSIVCLPCGVDHLGMPFGIQVVGPNGSDARVLEIAYALQSVLADAKETARAVPDLRRMQ